MYLSIIIYVQNILFCLNLILIIVIKILSIWNLILVLQVPFFQGGRQFPSKYKSKGLSQKFSCLHPSFISSQEMFWKCQDSLGRQQG